MESSVNEQTTQEIVDRLARIEGQIRGLSKMIQEHRPCDQVLVQVMAARAALEKVAASVVSSGIDECLALPAEQAREKIHRSIQLFTKV